MTYVSLASEACGAAEEGSDLNRLRGLLTDYRLVSIDPELRLVAPGWPNEADTRHPSTTFASSAEAQGRSLDVRRSG